MKWGDLIICPVCWEGASVVAAFYPMQDICDLYLRLYGARHKVHSSPKTSSKEPKPVPDD